MFSFDMDKIELNRLNRRPGLPKPGRQHGGGGKLRGKKDDKFIDTRPSVNKVNPALRGQTNMVAGKFLDLPDDIDTVAPMANKYYSVANNTVSRPRRKPLRSRLG